MILNWRTYLFFYIPSIFKKKRNFFQENFFANALLKFLSGLLHSPYPPPPPSNPLINCASHSSPFVKIIKSEPVFCYPPPSLQGFSRHYAAWIFNVPGINVNKHFCNKHYFSKEYTTFKREKCVFLLLLYFLAEKGVFRRNSWGYGGNHKSHFFLIKESVRHGRSKYLFSKMSWDIWRMSSNILFNVHIAAGLPVRALLLEQRRQNF